MQQQQRAASTSTECHETCEQERTRIAPHRTFIVVSFATYIGECSTTILSSDGIQVAALPEVSGMLCCVPVYLDLKIHTQSVATLACLIVRHIYPRPRAVERKRERYGMSTFPARATLGAEPRDNTQAKNIGGLIYATCPLLCCKRLSRLTRHEDITWRVKGGDE